MGKHAAVTNRVGRRGNRPAPRSVKATFASELMCPATACMCAHARRAARSFTRYYDEWLKTTGLRSTQVILLMHIDAAGPRALSALADELFMDRTTLSRNVKPLAARRWVTMRPGRDKREIIVATTDLGRAKLELAHPHWEGAQSRLVAAFGRKRTQTLLTALKHGAQVPQRLLDEATGARAI